MRLAFSRTGWYHCKSPFGTSFVAPMSRRPAAPAKPDWYGILEVPKNASEDDLRKAYKRLALVNCAPSQISSGCFLTQLCPLERTSVVIAAQLSFPAVLLRINLLCLFISGGFVKCGCQQRVVLWSSSLKLPFSSALPAADVLETVHRGARAKN